MGETITMRKNKLTIFILVLILISTVFAGISNGQLSTEKYIKDNSLMKSNNNLAALAFEPKSYDFGDIEKGETSNTTFEIWNQGCCSLEYELYWSEDWVDVSPIKGYSIGEHDIITVKIDTSELPVGLHTGDISIITDGGNGNFTFSVNVLGEPYNDITVDQAWDLLSNTSNGIQIPIDVRTDGEWKEEHIDTPNPEHPRHHNYIDWNDPDVLNDFLTTYEGQELIIYCKAGGRSASAATILVQNGFNGVVYNMLGGITEWKNKRYPVTGHTQLEFVGFQSEIGVVSINIKNSGSYAAKNISTTIEVSGGFLSLINLKHTSDCETPLEPEAIKTESTSKAGTIFGFGPIEINVTVSAKNADEISIEKEAFVIGLFTIIN